MNAINHNRGKVMEIVDSYGDAVLVLPDSARCTRAGENPCYMDDCPTMEFDGDCCPELCQFYTED